MTTDSISAEPAQPAPATAPRMRGQIGTRQLIIGLVVIIVLALLARFGYTYYIDFDLYVTTDDAMVDSESGVGRADWLGHAGDLADQARR